MGAIRGKENIIYLARQNRIIFWKIYDGPTARKAGACVFEADQDPNLSAEQSLDQLINSLDRLVPSRYIFTGMRKWNSKIDVDVDIELESIGTGTPSVISGINTAVSGFFMEGIGQVTPENFEAAIESKIKKVQDEAKKAAELDNLKEELKALKAEKIAGDNNFRNGVMSIGAIAWPHLKKSPVVSELMGSIGGLVKLIDNAGADDAGPEPAQIGDANQEQARAEKALEKLATNNPNFAIELEMLATLKEKNPEMYAQGLDFIKDSL